MAKNNNGQFFTNIEIIGDKVYERYIDHDGLEKSRVTAYQPTLFLKTQVETNYKDIYGNYCQPKKFESIRDANNWRRRFKEDEVLGMDNFQIAYLSDAYKEDIQYDMSKIRIAIFDIEVTSDGEFPEADEAKYPIDVITLYDTLDDKIYVFDLIEDNELDLPRVEPWKPDLQDLDQETLNKVEYMPFTSSDNLLLAFVKYLRVKTPSILAGWNSEKFDIPYVMNRLINRFGEDVANKISPYNEVYKRRGYDQYENEFTTYSPKGFSHLDYMELYKTFRFKTQPSYSLDYISKAETGIGKVEYLGPIHTLRSGNYIPIAIPEIDENSDKMQKWLRIKYIIQSFYEERKFLPRFLDVLINYMKIDNAEEEPDKLLDVMDKLYNHPERVTLTREEDEKLTELKNLIYAMYSKVSHRKYISYAIQDVATIKKMDDALSYFELVFDIAYYAKMPISNVTSKIQIWDAIIFNSLKRRKMVVPMKDVPEHNERIVGAFVKDPIVGTYKYVLSFDLTSLK